MPMSLEEMMEFLFQLRYNLCKDRTSCDWTMKDLGEVLKVSKNNKARDAHGHTYEVFKFGGGDLKKS